jgi:ribosomal protein S18 acetylase RimI-like enzyme
MVAGLDRRRNTASAAAVAAHLAACDASFVPPLSGRVDVDAYAAKIAGRAERFEAWSGDTLAGLVAAYAGDPDGTAFITNVSVLPAFARRGIAAALLQDCIAWLRGAGRHWARLEVSGDNSAAIHLYRGFGFTGDAAGTTLTLTLDLRARTP